MNKEQQKFDIIIMGSGMVGAAFACAMAQKTQAQGYGKNLSIAIIDTQSPSYNWEPNSFDIRVSALTHYSSNFLAQLGVWSKIKELGAYDYQQMQVWDNTGQGEIHFDAQEVGANDLGHIVENRITQSVLQQRMDDFEQITFIHPFIADKVEFLENEVLITDKKGASLSCQLIVGADGANSWLRQQANIDIYSWAYQQTALVTTVKVTAVKTSLSHQKTCWQQFMPTGPLAFLPLADNIYSIVWSTTASQAESLLALSDKKFNASLEETFGDRLGRLEVCSQRAIFPLRMRHAKQYTQPRLALMGDAAHTIHPLAGQGVNLGFADAQALAIELEQALKKHTNIFDSPTLYATLRKYERTRKSSNVAMLSSMEILKRLFSNQNPVLSLLRNTGLNIVASSSISRKFFMNYALGEYNS